jgi:hypothetical protein
LYAFIGEPLLETGAVQLIITLLMLAEVDGAAGCDGTIAARTAIEVEALL